MKVSSIALASLIAACGPPRSATPAAPPAPVGVPASPPSVAGTPAGPSGLRLPRTFLPTQYTARLAVDPARDDFTGSIQIAGTLSARTSVIWLHGQQLRISKAVAQRANVEVALAVTLKGTDVLELRAAEPLDPGEWTLAFDYRAPLEKVNTTGPFKQIVDGRAFVFTQLQATYARRVFPCLDEPDNKVPWKLTLDVPKPLLAVANAPPLRETALDSRSKRVEFAPTKPLPTYLVAFGVGPFEIVDAGQTKRGTPVRIVTLPGRTSEAEYAARVSARIVDITEEWFATPYPYEKLDLLTIPVTVGFGAMENAGLVTFSEALMLLDPHASQARKRRYALVAAHEIAHQWFGNLVTPVFWDDLWLNEGFATWLAAKIIDRFEPSWRSPERRLLTRNASLVADELVSARQIRQPITSSDDIHNAFDSITYGKGASVLAMFETYLGPDVLQRGVRAYVAARAWGNATSADLVKALSEAAGKDLEPAFGAFLDQAGAPEITATARCSEGKPSVDIVQRRYLPPGAPTPAASKPWMIPLCIAHDQNGARGQTCTVLDRPTATLALGSTSCPRWVMPNVDGAGYYRVAYTTAELVALRDEAWPKLSWVERRAVFFDVSTAGLTGKLPLQLALSLVPKLVAGNDQFTIPQALELPAGVEHLIADPLRPKYEHWLRQQFGPAALSRGILPGGGDTLDVEVTREELLWAVGWSGREPTLVAEAVKLADRWRTLPQSIRGVVLAIAVDARGDIFDKVLSEVGREPDRSRRREMYDALSRVRDPARKRAALALMADPAQDTRETLQLLHGNSTEATRAVAQQYFRDHVGSILGRTPGSEVGRTHVRLASLFTATCNAERRDAVADFVTKTFAPLPGGPRVVRQAIEGMDQCIARRRLLEPQLRAWLAGIRIPKPRP